MHNRQHQRPLARARLATCVSMITAGLALAGFSALANASNGHDNDNTSWRGGDRHEMFRDRLEKIRLDRLHRLTNLTVWNLFPEADEFTDKATNLAVLIQTLDRDGDLNNGIEVSWSASRIVADYRDQLTFDQPPAEFAQSSAVTDLMATLNDAGESVFNDTDPRPRRLRGADDAVDLVARAQSDRKVVKTSLGVLRGFTTADERAWAFYGIPYAKPPLGDLRWKPPVAHEGWRGVREALAWSDQSAQDPASERFGKGGMSEDSLYLNVTVPKDAGKDPLPVMVWFHGGGFSSLTGNTEGFNNTSLPAEGVVVVTVNHRLGPFGYMAHPALTAESDNNASGNYGQLDLIAALEWVQDNIERFGGDADNVTIFGESGGGGKTLSLLYSPLAEGLFHKAIVQSGMSVMPGTDQPISNPLAAQEAAGVRLAEALGVADAPDVLAAMRDIPWPQIVAATTAARFTAYPNLDGWYATQGIRDAFEAGEHHDVPIMAGATAGDYPTLIAGLKAYMPWMAEYNQSDVFTYVFDHVPAGWRAAGIPPHHGIDLVYMFDDPGSYIGLYLLGFSGHDDPTREKFATVDAPGVDPAEYAFVSELSLDLWASFAKDGDPAVDRQPWPAYTPDNDTYLRIGLTPAVETGLDDAFPEPSPTSP